MCRAEKDEERGASEEAPRTEAGIVWPPCS